MAAGGREARGSHGPIFYLFVPESKKTVAILGIEYLLIEKCCSP